MASAAAAIAIPTTLSTCNPNTVRSFSSLLPLSSLSNFCAPPIRLSLRSTFAHLQPRLLCLKAVPCSRRQFLVRACLNNREESILPTESDSDLSFPLDSKEVKFDLKLPRRNLLVEFTCNSCGERTKRIINRLAYEKGTVFVQCAGCLSHHKLVDNLDLVVEYDLRSEREGDCDPLTQD